MEASQAPRSAMASQASCSAMVAGSEMAAGVPGSAMAAGVPGSAMGPGTGTALEATCPVSKSLRPPERPPPSPFDVIRRGTHLLEGGGNVRLCLPLPLFPHPYMVLSVSQSLLVQSVSAVCLDYVPGVSSYVSLYLVCSAPCYRWIIVNVMCVKLVWMSFPVFMYPVLCIRHPLNTLFVISSSPRSWIPVSTVTHLQTSSGFCPWL